MKVKITNKIMLSNIPEVILTAICEKLTMSNPKWHENEKMGRWNGETPRLLRFYRQTGQGTLVLPRGYTRQLIYFLRQCDTPYRIIDNRRELDPAGFRFNGQLRAFQEEAVGAMLNRDFGTLSSPTGSGKTVMALYMIAERKQPALVVVHTKELLNQWIDRIEAFLGIPKDAVGIIGAGKKRIGERVKVALVQTLYKCADLVSGHIGHLVVDECHRAPSRTFTEAVTAFDCKYMLGLSATPWRRDKLSRLIFWHLGDVHHKIEAEDLVETGDVLRAKVISRETDFRPWHDPVENYTMMLSELTGDKERNLLIASDIATEASNGSGICLVLSDRKAHCEALQALLNDNFDISSDLLTGDIPTRKREGVVERLNNGQVKVLVATGQLIGEGFDCKELSTLFMATPVRFNGRVLQYLGRILRPAPGERRAKVFDYIDSNVGVLVASAKARSRVFKSIKD
jgi:superfamily II DNA or RNA helicase